LRNKYYEIECDSCGCPDDGDPIENEFWSLKDIDGVKDPVKLKTLQYFWLCPDCHKEYPKGATNFFAKSYFTEDELYCCVHCGEFIPEEVLDKYDDTEVCLTCSPPIDEE
jgi:uncharacterized CHY-type Zn-finger protein